MSGGEPSRRRPLLQRGGAVAGIAVALCALLFGAGYALSAFVLYPPKEAPPPGVEVPALSGSTLAEAERALQAAGLRMGRIQGLPNPVLAAGVVSAQDPLPGQRARPGDSVDVGYSIGRARARVPDVVGLKEEVARRVLDVLGFQQEVQFSDQPYLPGYVMQTVPAAGAEVLVPARITLYVSRPLPPPDTLPPPQPPDSAAVLPDTAKLF